MAPSRPPIAKVIGQRSLAVVAAVAVLALLGTVGYAVSPLITAMCVLAASVVLALILIVLRAELRETRREIRRLLHLQRDIAARVTHLEQTCVAELHAINVPAPKAASTSLTRQERLALEARSTAQLQRVIELLTAPSDTTTSGAHTEEASK